MVGHYSHIVDFLRTAWWRFSRLWKPMAWWTLLSWVLIAVILVPLTSGFLSYITFSGDRIMVANEDILRWMLTPMGIFYLFMTAGLAVIGAVFRYAGLFFITREDLYRRKVSLQDILLQLLPDLPSLFRLCLKSAAAGILMLIPLVAGAGIFYLIFLTEHDINYYLYQQPAEWQYALIATGIWAAIWGAGLLYLLLRSLPALPAFLDGHRPVKSALNKSWSSTKGYATRFLLLLLMCFVIWFLIRFVMQSLLFAVGAFTIDAAFAYFDSLTPLLLITASYALTGLIVDIVISFIGFSFASVILTEFYYKESGLHRSAPAVIPGLTKIPAKAIKFTKRWMQPMRAMSLLTLAAILGAGVGLGILYQTPEERSFTVTAHRAGAFLAPENSLAALERAIDAGSDYVEIDVQTTKDGEVVVTHDADLKRLTGDPRRIDEVNYSDIQHLVKETDMDIPEEERRIATLDQFLERSKDRVKLNIELKYYGPDPELAGRTIERVRNHDMADQVVIMSFDWEAVNEVQRLAPEIPTGYVASVAFGDLTRLPVDFLAIPMPLANESFIRSAQDRDLEIHIWTINTLEGMLDAAQRGADSIITDDPVLALQLRKELENLSPPERLLLSLRPQLEF